VVYLLAVNEAPGGSGDLSIGLVRSVMTMVLDISRD
jgi:hypothetical protein